MSFTYLFGLQSTVVHTLIISLVLFIVGALDCPLRGDVRISPDAFFSMLERFERSRLSEL